MGRTQSAAEAVTIATMMPPPVNGATITTAELVASLRQRGNVILYPWTGCTGSTGNGAKTLRAIWSAVALAVRPRCGRSFFTVAHSGLGIWLNILNCAVARMRGYRCVVHHHASNYVDEHYWTIRLLDRIMGPTGVHVVGSPEMGRRILGQYGSRGRYFELSNAITIADRPESSTVARKIQFTDPNSLHTPFTIGHLSNLSLAKGLGHVIRTFALLRDKGDDVRLLLAGPVTGPSEARMIHDAEARYPAAVRYLGPLYGEDKERFYQSIDVFLFPTEYKVETYPVVLVEALNQGAPVIAYGRACIPYLVGNGGVVVPPEDDFVAASVPILTGWMRRPELHRSARSRAVQQGKALRENAQRQLASLCAGLLSDDWEAPVRNRTHLGTRREPLRITA